MKGFAITDWFDERTWYITSFNAILNGNDLPDGQYKKDSINNLNNYKTGYGKLAWSMRESAHRILYTVAHSNAMNEYKTGMKVIPITPKWIKQPNKYETAIRICFIVVPCLRVAINGLRFWILRKELK